MEEDTEYILSEEPNPSVSSNENHENDIELIIVPTNENHENDIELIIVPTNENHENDIEPIIIVPTNEKLIALQERTKKSPKLLKSEAAHESCSIFRVPQNILNLHPRSFQPELVSIGPYYHGDERLQMMEEQKCRILGVFFGEIQKIGADLDELYVAIEEKEEEIRACYSQDTEKFSSEELIEMMIVDGCFIIHQLAVIGEVIFPGYVDPIFNLPWMEYSILRDLLMLENQIPFFVLQILYEKSLFDHLVIPPMQVYMLKLINNSLPRCDDVNKLCDKYKDFEGEHILDFYRSTYIPPEIKDGSSSHKMKIFSRWFTRIEPKEDSIKERDSLLSGSRNSGMSVGKSLHSSLSKKEEASEQGDPEENKEETKDIVEKPLGWGMKLLGLVGIRFKEKVKTEEDLLQFIQPVEKLLQAGIKFKKKDDTDSFLDINFSHGALRIPRLATGETVSTLILNCIVFEECYQHRTKHFISYFNFMSYLLNTTFDAGYLREKKIIENFFGTDEELVKFFNEVGKNIPYFYKEDYLMAIAKQVEKYYRNAWHVGWAEFKYTYCGSVWVSLSALAALLVVLLTALQTVYAVYAYHKPSG